MEDENNHHIAPKPKPKRKMASRSFPTTGRGFSGRQPKWKLQLNATRGGYKARKDRSKP